MVGDHRVPDLVGDLKTDGIDVIAEFARLA